MAPGERIRVLVAWGRAAGQRVIELEVPAGTTAAEAAAAAALPPDGTAPAALGIWGEVVPPDRVLAAGDRLELYCGLVADPKDQRRQRALKRR